MENELYNMIFKRKSFHLFRDVKGEISKEELNEIEEVFKTLKTLDENIKIDMKIVKAEETTCKRGEEYCILLYSEKKGNYLANIGYIGEQLELYLAYKNIGALWFGIGKIEKVRYNDLDFVIMIAIAKEDKDNFRKDMFKSKRKNLDKIYSGEGFEDIINIARFSPSACNTQPWKVEVADKNITVYRYKKPGKRGIMPVAKVAFYNRIDIGIFLQILELCLKHNNLDYDREMYQDDYTDDEKEKVKIVKYNIKRSL